MTRELLNLESAKRYTWVIDFSAEEAKRDYEYFQRQDRKAEQQLIESIVRNSGLVFDIR